MLDLAPLARTAAASPARPYRLPGMTASGLASPAQLVGSTTYAAPRLGTTAASDRLLLAAPTQVRPPSHPVEPLVAAAYPILAGIWDNDDDALYDSL